MLTKRGTFALVLLACAAGAAFLAWHFGLFDAGRPGERDAVADAASGSETGVADDPASLALKSITLTQGEKGLELWRLRATWANMLEQDGLVIVEMPRLTYYLSEDKAEVLQVESDRGDIDQEGQVLRFVENVVAAYNDSVVSGELLVYNGTVRTMTFPQGGVFTGTGVNGTAPHIVWYMDTKIIEATNGVSVFFQGRSPEAAQAPVSDAAPEAAGVSGTGEADGAIENSGGNI